MNDGSDGADPAPAAAHRSIFTKLLVAAAAGLLIWWALPGVPREQTVIFALGPGSSRVSRLEIDWERTGTDHIGQVTLNFPSAQPLPSRAAGTTSEQVEAPLPAPGNSDSAAGALAGASEISAAQSSAPESVVHHFRLADGEYSFRISARRTDLDSERTEVTRRVTLNGNTLILRLEELTR